MVNESKMRLLGYKIPVAGSSYRTEQIAVKLALENLVQVAEDEHESLTTTTHLLTDSMSVMQALEQGPYKQRSPMNKKIWKLAMKLEKKGIQVNMQYVPAHRNVRYNEVADQLAKFAAGLKEDPPHEDVIIKQLPTQLDMNIDDVPQAEKTGELDWTRRGKTPSVHRSSNTTRGSTNVTL